MGESLELADAGSFFCRETCGCSPTSSLSRLDKPIGFCYLHIFVFSYFFVVLFLFFVIVPSLRFCSVFCEFIPWLFLLLLYVLCLRLRLT
ncbi:hypothetical protein [Apis mellifera associated microvirus 5]|nr:hypothetical protein [Apis mellifera associated microvirus 5]